MAGTRGAALLLLLHTAGACTLSAPSVAQHRYSSCKIDTNYLKYTKYLIHLSSNNRWFHRQVRALLLLPQAIMHKHDSPYLQPIPLTTCSTRTSHPRLVQPGANPPIYPAACSGPGAGADGAGATHLISIINHTHNTDP